SVFDAVVVGSGAGGGIVVKELAAAGWSVALLERGPWLESASFGHVETRDGWITGVYRVPCGPAPSEVRTVRARGAEAGPRGRPVAAIPRALCLCPVRRLQRIRVRSGSKVFDVGERYPTGACDGKLPAYPECVRSRDYGRSPRQPGRRRVPGGDAQEEELGEA